MSRLTFAAASWIALLTAGAGVLAVGAIAAPPPGWTITANQNAYGHVGAVLVVLGDGRALLAGGKDATGSATGSATGTAEIYDPTLRTWSHAASMRNARFEAAGVLLPSGHVLVVGGLDQTDKATSTAELYDPGTNSWALTATSMSAARYRQTATLIGQKVMVAGGEGGAGAAGSSDLFDSVASTWSAGPPLLTPRDGHTAAALPSSPTMTGGGVLIGGGVPTLQTPLGPQRAGVTANTEVYDPTRGAWLPGPPMPHARTDMALTPSNGDLVAAGGIGCVPPDTITCTHPDASIDVYQTATGAWTTSAGALTPGRYGHTATTLPDGSVLLAGGGTAPPAPLTTNSTEVFREATPVAASTVTLAPEMNSPRIFGAAALLPGGGGCGEVLVAGGENALGPVKVSELFDALPWLASLSPRQGSAWGGDTVSVTGDVGGTTASFGGAASAAAGSSPGAMTVTTPVAAGQTAIGTPVDVTLARGSCSSRLTSADRFTYLAPVVTRVSASYGPMSGGTPLDISGTGLNAVSGVRFTFNAGAAVTVPASPDGSGGWTLTTPHAPTAEIAAVDVVGPPGSQPASAGTFAFGAGSAAGGTGSPTTLGVGLTPTGGGGQPGSPVGPGGYGGGGGQGALGPGHTSPLGTQGYGGYGQQVLHVLPNGYLPGGVANVGAAPIAAAPEAPLIAHSVAANPTFGGGADSDAAIRYEMTTNEPAPQTWWGILAGGLALAIACVFLVGVTRSTKAPAAGTVSG